jgi:hypothetical protein
MIKKISFQADDLIPERDGERFGIPVGSCEGQTWNIPSAMGNRMTDVTEIHTPAPVFTQNPQGRGAVVTHAGTGIFLGQGVRGEAAVQALLIRVSGEAAVKSILLYTERAR